MKAKTDLTRIYFSPSVVPQRRVRRGYNPELEKSSTCSTNKNNNQQLKIPELPTTLDELRNQLLSPFDDSFSSSPPKDHQKNEEDPVIQKLLNREVRLTDRTRGPPDKPFYLCCNCDPNSVFTICLDCVPAERFLLPFPMVVLVFVVNLGGVFYWKGIRWGRGKE